MALQMFEWISIIMVIKYEDTLDIDQYENNLKKSKEAKKNLNRRESYAWCAFKFLITLYCLLLITVKATSAIGISLPRGSLPHWFEKMDDYFRDDEFNMEMTHDK